MRPCWENLSIRKKTWVIISLLFLLSHSASAVTIGPMQTKKERNRDQSSSGTRDAAKPPKDKTMEAFLREDHALVEKLTKSLLKRTHSHPEVDEMVYIRALSLMKLGRMDEARLLLIELENRGLTPDMKARAAYSLGDSYYFTSGDTKAYQNALSAYPLFDEADSVRLRIRERHVATTPVSTQSQNSANTYTLSPKPLQQMGLVETPLYSVQVGSFSKEKNAKQLLSKLMRVRYDAHVLKDDTKQIYRVRVGSYVSRHDALILERKLKKEGYPTKIVP